MRQNNPKAVRLFFVLVFVILFSSTRGLSQNFSTALTSDLDSVQVGDVFHLNVKIQTNQQVDRLIIPDSSTLTPELEWLGVQQYKVTDFADSLKIKVQFFGSEDLFIPGIPVRFVVSGDTTVSFTNNLIIPFNSVLEPETTELKPIKPIFDFEKFPWAYLILALGIIAAAIWAYFTFLKKKEEPTVVKVVKQEPFKSPLTELEDMLLTLKNDYNLSETQDFKYFYSTISDSVRKYYEDLYAIPALESTTREVLRFLDAFGVDLEMIKLSRAILNKSDMVKFAKFTPTLEGAWSCHNDALAFLERAKLIDADRIARKKADYESQWKMSEATIDVDDVPDVDVEPDEEDKDKEDA